MFQKVTRSQWVEIFLLAMISAITYLPDSTSLNYYRDDWYYMYDGLVRGAQIFNVMFSHLRPARGPLFAFLFNLFGTSPLPYHLTLFLWRLLGGLGMFWLFDLLWPKSRSARFFAALLFIIYPGFIWWVAGIEYQPMVISVGLQVFSIALTIKALQTKKQISKVIWYALAFLSGLYALALVDYAIGVEALRLLVIFLVVRRELPGKKLWKQVVDTFKLALSILLIPLVYLVWRQFFFENWREATDIKLQLVAALSSVDSLLWSFLNILRSALNVSIFAWVLPFNSSFYTNYLHKMYYGLAFAALGACLALSVDWKYKEKENQPEPSKKFVREAILLGAAGIFFGILPVVVGNRFVEFSRFSHYALPASIASVFLVIGLIFSFSNRLAHSLGVFFLVGLAILTHRGVSTGARLEEATIQDFWWQMSWRAPDISSQVLFAVNYPFNYADDADVVYGPANFIYYPEKQEKNPAKIHINATDINASMVENILVGKLHLNRNYYGAHKYRLNFRNVLIVTQPFADSCIRVIDARWPDLSIYDADWVLVTASKSETGNIIPDGSTHKPPEYLFNAEPEHTWCYYYQKADLARQVGDWEKIVQLDNQASEMGLFPIDQIELMPFLQAYAFLNNVEKVKEISVFINTEAWYKQQTCQNLRGMEKNGYPLQEDILALVEELFCTRE